MSRLKIENLTGYIAIAKGFLRGFKDSDITICKTETELHCMKGHTRGQISLSLQWCPKSEGGGIRDVFDHG